MRARYLRALGRGLICTGLMIFLWGCSVPRPQHGFIIRGDWSLELNRIPWMADRGIEYQNAAENCDCCPDDCAGTNCSNGRNAAGCRHAAAAICANKPGLGGSSPASDTILVSDQSGSRGRFFPVPTRPAFSKHDFARSGLEEVRVLPSPTIESVPSPPPEY